MRRVVGALQDEIGTAFEKRYKEKFGANAGHNSGAQSYDGAYVWATAAALAGGSGEPGNEEQNRKVAARMRAMIYRGVTGTTRFIPDEQAAYTYPTQVSGFVARHAAPVPADSGSHEGRRR